MRSICCALVLACGSVAIAAPVSLNHQLRAMDALGHPLEGSSTSVEVILWKDAVATGAANQYWTHTFQPDFQLGYATLVLDTNVGGDQVQGEWFGRGAWIEVKIDGESMGNRQPVRDVPLAAAASSANGQVWTLPEGVFELVEYPTSWQVTPSSYTGSVSYTDNEGRDWIGRPATTAICQDMMGSGARICHHEDVARFIATGGVNGYQEGDPDKINIPGAAATQYWVSTGGDTDIYNSTVAHRYADCFHFTSASGTYRGAIVAVPDSNYYYGATFAGHCDTARKLLCCR